MRFNPHIFFILPLIILVSYPSIISLTGKQKYILEHHQSFSTNLNQGNSPPEVKIELPDESGVYHWGDRVRYSISVSDAQDGESRYGEINPNEVLLDITYLGSRIDDDNVEQVKSGYKSSVEHAGLSLIRKSNCFSCHLDKTTLVGPSFSDISDRYEPEQDVLQRLGNHIAEGSSGVWGSIEMPPHENISLEEAVEIAAYILEQGSRENQWIYPGLEGIFRIIEKPENVDTGIYILTASYINHGTEGVPGTGVRGEHTIMLEIE